MLQTMQPPGEALPCNADQLNASACWHAPRVHLSGVLPQQQPFRDQTLSTETMVFLPDEDGEAPVLHRVESDRGRGRRQDLYVEDDGRCHRIELEQGPRIGPWAEHDLLALLAEQAEHLDMSLRRCAERMAMTQVPRNEQGWRWHPWLGFGRVH